MYGDHRRTCILFLRSIVKKKVYVKDCLAEQYQSSVESTKPRLLPNLPLTPRALKILGLTPPCFICKKQHKLTDHTWILHEGKVVCMDHPGVSKLLQEIVKSKKVCSKRRTAQQIFDGEDAYGNKLPPLFGKLMPSINFLCPDLDGDIIDGEYRDVLQELVDKK